MYVMFSKQLLKEMVLQIPIRSKTCIFLYAKIKIKIIIITFAKISVWQFFERTL